MRLKSALVIVSSLLLLTSCSSNNNPNDNKCDFSFLGEHCSLNNEASYEKDSKVSLKFTVDPGYYLPQTIMVKGCDDYIYNASDMSLEMTIKSDITVACSANEIKDDYYLVTFHANGGSEIPVQAVISGEKATKPTNPIKNKFIFGGWYDNEELKGEEFDFSTPIKHNYDLYALWEEGEADLLYRLEFSDKNNLGHNTGESKFKDAINNGDGKTIVPDVTHKGENVLKFADNKGVGTNYFSLPVEPLINKTTTIATWVKMPVFTLFNDNSTLFGVKWRTESGFYVSPFSSDSWNGYAINDVKYGSINNLTNVPASPYTPNTVTPIAGTIQSLENGWHLIGFTFAPNYLHVYQNGKLILSYTGSYSFESRRLEEFTLGYSSLYREGNEFNGSLSDFRIYNYELTRQDYRSEYSLEAKDFLTTDYEFNDSNFKDEVRDITATKIDSPTIKTVDDRSVCDLSGTIDNQQSLELPNSGFMGHNEITISTDIYLKESYEAYQRLFDFCHDNDEDVRRYLTCHIGYNLPNREMTYDVRYEFVYNSNNELQSDDMIVSNPEYFIPKEQWINITMSASKLGGAIYVNGDMVAYNTNLKYDPSFLADYNDNDDFCCRIGSSKAYGNMPLQAYLDNFRVYSVALEENDIRTECCHQEIMRDDAAAINLAKSQFTPKYHTTKLETYIANVTEGVSVKCTSLDCSIIDKDGNILASDKDQTCPVKATFYRGDFSDTKIYYLTVPAVKSIEVDVKDPGLNNTRFVDGDGYYDTMFNQAMRDNFDYMMTLDVDNLLYNYRLNAGLDHPGESYGGWISTGSGGAGQFETMYIGALARYTQSLDEVEDEARLTQANERLTEMLDAIDECQQAYAQSFPEQAGYVSAIPHEVIDAYDNGCGDSASVETHIGSVNAWVPYYMYHKNIHMLHDVYEFVADESLREKAKDMFLKGTKWLSKHTNNLIAAQKPYLFMHRNSEYGGLMEMIVRAYEMTKDPEYLKTFRFFEQEGLIDAMANNNNVLHKLHCNTTVPKILAAAAMYEVTGDEHYRRAAENGWKMIVEQMTYANGGISRDESFEQPGLNNVGPSSLETCCSYNMMRLTDYIFRWNPKPEYAHYFEKVFYNHIMGSMYVQKDGDGNVINAAKCYNQDSRFGHFRVYSSATESFWCCCCTGQETFSKLTYGQFYHDQKENKIYVNMYNSAKYNYAENKGISILGDYLTNESIDVKFDESVNLNNYRFIIPSWCKDSKKPVVKINNVEVNYEVENGYIKVDKTVQSTDKLTINLPMSYYLINQRGHENENLKALYYGPLLIEPNLGHQTGDEDEFIKTGPSSGTSDYTGGVSQILDCNGKTIDQCFEKSIVNGQLQFKFKYGTGDLIFIPYMDIGYNRSSMYMIYNNLA